MMWEPTIGKWYEDENYDIKEPLFRKLLELTSHHGHIKKLQQIISWFSKRNMYGDYYRIVLIGCFLKQKGVCLEEYISEPFLSVIAEIAAEADTIEECAVCLLKKQNVDEEFIDEFGTQFIEQRMI